MSPNIPLNPPKDKKFYGSVTVSERGQIVIPADARKDFDITPGEKILVFGDLKTGLWITTFNILQENVQGGMEMLKHMASRLEKSEKD